MPHVPPKPLLCISLLLALPVALAIFCSAGPFTTDPNLLFSGLATDVRPGWLPGFGTADPNMGFTSYALGKRAALDVLAGRLPLWDHLEGLGAPLLGSMQPAALFPPTLLLLLPHGQVIEQTFLQFVAGLGTYLFLRRFGLGTTASLAGGLLFELNGVFALLRNAVFNPVAFLPWLLYVVESLHWHRASPWRSRLPFIGLGALAAALSLYAGFPEVVYLYTLLILLWVLARAVSLPGRQRPAFLGSLVAAALLALVIAAPLLLAFADFLPEAIVGFHTGEAVDQPARLPSSLLLIWLPWIYGPIAGAPVTSAAIAWNGMGGYLGLTPLLLAVAGLWCGRRTPMCWVMAAWTGISIAVSHAAPIVYPIFLLLPLTKMTLFFRYLDTGWILCCITLGAVFLDRLPALSRAQSRRSRLVALGGAALVLALSLHLAAAPLAALWALAESRRYELAYGGAGLAIVACFAATRSRKLLIAMAVTEAAVTFLVPLASFKHAKHLDWPLITFLRDHVGLQRMASAASFVVTPNFGPAFGFASINYDEVPVPTRTAAFVRTSLDPAAIPWAFSPKADWNRSDDELRQTVLAHLAGYQRAAVRYLVGPPELFATPAYELSPAAAVPLPLAAGGEIVLTVPPRHRALRDAALLLGTYGGVSDGTLRLRACQGSDACSFGSADLKTAANNRYAVMRLSPVLALDDTQPVEITIRKEGGEHPVALWSRPALPPGSGPKPMLMLVPDDLPPVVFASATGSVFELPGAEPYMTAPGCTLAIASRNQVRATCPTTARLLRREVWMRGWTARLSGRETAIQLADDTFQAVDVPPGETDVEFRYEPRGVRASFWPALGALLLAGALLLSGRSKTVTTPGP